MSISTVLVCSDEDGNADLTSGLFKDLGPTAVETC
jgi:hypothetical protein